MVKIRIMEGARVPKPLLVEGNLSENFKRFKQSFEIYKIASGLVKKDKDVQAACLLNLMGEEAIEIFNTFNLSVENSKDSDKIMEAFEAHMDPKKNLVVERFKFNSRVQYPHESFDIFLTDLKRLLKNCEFKDQAESLLRDRIVLGIADKSVQERLLRDPDLPLDQTLKLCRASELGRLQAEAIKAENNISLDGVRSYQSRPSGSSNYVHDRPSASGKKYQENKELRNTKFSPGNRPKSFTSESAKQGSNFYLCLKCNRTHGPVNCPAYGKKCNNCHKYNHFAVGCKIKNCRGAKGLQECVNEPDLILDSISTVAALKNEWLHPLQVEGIEMNFKVDTGAEVNVIPSNVLNQIKQKYELETTNMVLEAYGGQRLVPVGVVYLNCKNTNMLKSEGRLGQDIILPFAVLKVNNVTDKFKPILGLSSCIKLGLVKDINVVGLESEMLNENVSVKKNEFLSQIKHLCEGVGDCKVECSFEVDENVKPVVKPPRRVPYAIMNKLQVKLQELEKDEIISKVENPNNWVSNLVVIEKADGSLRLCLDCSDLNKAIKREHFLIPSYNEIVSKLTNKKLFSVMDLKESFYHLRLDEKSSDYCTFNTVFGMYKFNRLPFGVSNAAEIFQKVNENNFKDIPNVIIYIDDLLIATENEEEHDKTLKLVVERATKLNLKFNKEKLQFKVKEVKFFGHCFSADGVRIDDDRVKALQALKAPVNKKELQRLMGLFNYLRSFVPNMAELTFPLRELLKKNIVFQWLPIHQKILEQLKKLIAEAPVLANFDEAKTVTIQCDASQNGTGCCLMMDNQPMAFGSRSLTESEKRFAQVEKEMLGIVHAVQKFHFYIYGRSVRVLTDCKPLVGLMSKNVVNVASPRLQRMKVKLMKYDLKVEYLQGKLMFVADLLSRDYLNEIGPSGESDSFSNEIVHCVGLAKHVSMSDKIKSRVKDELLKDVSLNKVMDYVKNGWPKSKNMVDEIAKVYYKMQSELSEDEGLLFLNDRVVIPVSMRKEILSKLHESHFGVEKTKSRARQVVYWPGMSHEIENLILNCSICAKYRANNIKEPLIPHEIPTMPFIKVACDLLDFENESYLVLSDYLSKWIELVKIKNKTACEVISKLKVIFATHGIPKQVVADNMPFNSVECKRFCNEWNFEFVYSSPMYPRSNGQAERAVQVCKNMLKKCKDSGKDLENALLEYRNMPIYNLNVSPSQILFSRMTRTKLPVSDKLLEPKVHLNVQKKLIELQGKSKLYYDRNTRVRQPFSPNEKVMLKNEKVWEPATVVAKHDLPRSYLVQTKRGNVVRRNSFFLRKSGNNKCNVYDDIYESVQNTPKISPTNRSSTHKKCLSNPGGYDTPQTNLQPNTPLSSRVNVDREKTPQNNDEVVSRYGRVIKPRRMLDL